MHIIRGKLMNSFQITVEQKTETTVLIQAANRQDAKELAVVGYGKCTHTKLSDPKVVKLVPLKGL